MLQDRENYQRIQNQLELGKTQRGTCFTKWRQLVFDDYPRYGVTSNKKEYLREMLDFGIRTYEVFAIGISDWNQNPRKMFMVFHSISLRTNEKFFSKKKTNQLNDTILAV